LILAEESTSKVLAETSKCGPGKADGKARFPEYSSKDLLILKQS
jgi:hypothetical protein